MQNQRKSCRQEETLQIYFCKEQKMSKFTRFVLGTATLAGVGYAGYKIKQHLDSQKAKPENEFLDYKDLAIQEAGKAVANALDTASEWVARGYEKIFDEPFYGHWKQGKILATINKSAHNSICKHLGEKQLAPTLIKEAEFTLAKHSRFDFGFLDNEQQDEADELWERGENIYNFIEAIYQLEAQCYEAHKAIVDFASFARESSSIDCAKLDDLSRDYEVYDSKYDLCEIEEIALVNEASDSIKNACEKLATLKSSGENSSALPNLEEALELALVLDSVIRGDFASGGRFCAKPVEALTERLSA